MDNWEKKAKRFIWEEHKRQLERSLSRHPNSPEAPRRQAELDRLNTNLENLNKD